MQFLTSESDLNINKEIVLCFYSSEESLPVASVLFSFIAKVSKRREVLCVDICYFDGIGKRFAITEIPTILLINNGKELKRISGALDQNIVDLF